MPVSHWAMIASDLLARVAESGEASAPPPGRRAGFGWTLARVAC
jgi:hypothetical protein